MPLYISYTDNTQMRKHTIMYSMAMMLGVHENDDK